jgi:hypothetical protein
MIRLCAAETLCREGRFGFADLLLKSGIGWKLLSLETMLYSGPCGAIECERGFIEVAELAVQIRLRVELDTLHLEY